MADKKEEKPRAKPKLTLLMVMCFIFEFCVRWTVNAFDSRYGFYLTDKFNTTSDTYSYFFLLLLLTGRVVVVISSVVTCVFQAFIYPWIVSTLNVPIPYLATIGSFIIFLSFILIAILPTEIGSISASVILWIGFCCAAPSSVSIISV